MTTPNIDPVSASETVVWAGTPSQWGNTGWFAACVLVVPIPYALWRWLQTRTTVFTLTDQRLKQRRGVFNRVTDDMELYRVKDTRFEQGFWQRMVGIGDIVLATSDASTPSVRLPRIRDAEAVREQIRRLVEQRRDAKRVRELDLGHDTL